MSMSAPTSFGGRLACRLSAPCDRWQAVRRLCHSPAIATRPGRCTRSSVGQVRLYRTSTVCLSILSSSIVGRTRSLKVPLRQNATSADTSDHINTAGSRAQHTSGSGDDDNAANPIPRGSYSLRTPDAKVDRAHGQEETTSSEMPRNGFELSGTVVDEPLARPSLLDKTGSRVTTTADVEERGAPQVSASHATGSGNDDNDIGPASSTLPVSEHTSHREEGNVSDEQAPADVLSSSPASPSTEAAAGSGSGSYSASRKGAGDGGFYNNDDQASSRSQSRSPQESILRKLFASWQQGVVASIGAFMGVGFIIFLFYAPVKEDTVHHTAVVASEALADTRLRAQAIELSKGVVTNILNDDASQAIVVKFVQKLLAQEDTRIAVSSLLRTLFEDHYTQEVTKKFVLTIVRDAWVREQLHLIAKEQALRILADEKVKQALSNLLITSTADALQEPELRYEAVRAVRSSIASIFRFF